MINVPGVNYSNPSVKAESVVVSSGVSIPANNRILCIIGEGARREVLVSYASGNGQDGLDSTYTTTTGRDGRRFLFGVYPVQAKRTVITKNGITLTGLEEAISITSPTSFSSIYDYRVDIQNGRLEMKPASLVDQGGAYYTASGTVVGTGTINNLSLIDSDAPAETWTIRCSSVRRDGYGVPIDGYARFVASGSVSGIILDGYGSPVVWQSDGVIRNNGILKFRIVEGGTPFDSGDTFVVRVASGVLSAGDQLIASYIATTEINDPEFFTDMDAITAKHGLVSTTNTLSLGCQLAFANGTAGVLCCQAAPPIPRRITYEVVEQATGGSTEEDMTFPLPIGVVPATNTEVTFFVVNTVTNVETQIIPNKVTFYNAGYTTAPTTFITGADPYSYTVIMQGGLKREGDDLVITPAGGNTAVVSSEITTFDLTDVTVNTSLTIFGATNANNNGDFTIVSVSEGELTISGSAPFVSETGLDFRLIDASEQSAAILWTQDLALTSTQGLKVGVIDTDDATFFDAGWINALEELESWELDILVPLPTQTISAIFQTSMQHVLAMSRMQNSKERMLFIGAINGLLPANVIGTNPAAVENIGVLEGIQGDSPTEILAGTIEDLTNYSVEDAFGNTFRCMYFYPDRIVVNITGTNTFIDGFYLAAAAGGYFSGVGNVAIPLTNKTLAGFSILNDRQFNNTVAENITRAGICLVEPVLGGGRVIWGKTTSQSGYPEDEEASIIFIRDKIAKNMRLGTRGFIGVVETPSFPISLKTRVGSLINSFMSQQLITAYGSIIVKRDTVEPRQWNISFAVQPSYAVNWIYIRFEVGVL